MNTSNSPMLNIGDSFPAMESNGSRAAASQPTASGETFGAVYDNESASHAAENRNKSLNNKDLDTNDDSPERASSEAEAVDDNGQKPEVTGDRGKVEARDHGPQDRQKEAAEEEHGAAERTLEDALLVGNTAPQPVRDSASNSGEILPPGGKVLPEGFDGSTKRSRLTGSTSGAEALAGMDAETGQMGSGTARQDAQDTSIRSQLRSDGRDIQSQAKLSPGIKNSVDFFQMDDAMDLAGDKVSSESIMEKLTSLSAFAAREPATTTVSTAPVATTAIAVATTDSPLSVAQSAAGSTAAENVDISLNVRGNSTDWSQAIGDKIRWMRNAQASTAELHLNPAELGSIEIKIVTEDQQARVHFVTSSALAQEMIEESLSKLEELLADHGIALDQSDINQKEKQNEFAQDDARSPARDSGPDSQFEHEATIATSAPTATRIGQVDQYV